MAGFEVIIYGRFWVITEDISTLKMYPTQAKLEWATLKASFSAAPLVVPHRHSER